MINKDLFKLLGKEKKLIIVIVLTMLISSFTYIGIIYLIVKCLEVLTNDLSKDLFIYYGIGIFSLILIRFVFSYITNTLKDHLGRKVKKKLREDVYNKIISIGKRSVDDLNMSGLIQVSIEGIEQLDIYYSTYLPQFFYSMISPLILFIITVFIDYKVSLVLLACVPLIPISIILVSKYAKKIFAKYWGKYTSMGDLFLDGLQGLKDLKIFNYDEEYNRKLNSSSEEFRKITMKVLIMQLFSVTIMDLVAYLGAGIGISLTIYDVQTSYINPLQGLFIILIAVEFFLPLRALGSAFHVAMNGISAGKKIFNLLNYKEYEFGNKEFEKGDLVFKNVDFSYEKGSDTLKDINLRFTKKGLYGIVGESGSGKSTLSKLICRFILPNNGEIDLNNVNINEISKENYYKNIALVDYDYHIFNESILANFRLVNRDVDNNMITSSLKDVHLEEFISDNYLEKINEDGENISGGQKQRLALAMNLTLKKDIYIFDEATSNIDVNSEEIIMKKIYELAKDSLVIVISHRLENVKNAKSIVFLDKGHIVEQGSHDYLMSIKGKYYSLYTKQEELSKSYLSSFKKEAI